MAFQTLNFVRSLDDVAAIAKESLSLRKWEFYYKNLGAESVDFGKHFDGDHCGKAVVLVEGDSIHHQVKLSKVGLEVLAGFDRGLHILEMVFYKPSLLYNHPEVSLVGHDGISRYRWDGHTLTLIIIIGLIIIIFFLAHISTLKRRPWWLNHIGNRPWHLLTQL